tara:strand:- start:103 stop:453 length:351 start_codon:yes stop_codon:yes gene_type:complete
MKKAFTKTVKISSCLMLLLGPLNVSAIDESDVSQMLNQFGQKGIISKEELIKAQEKLKNISPDKWKKINAYANSQMDAKGRTPSSNNIDEAAANIDTNSAEFKNTMEDLKKIMIDK